jgi:hypothetical protein
MDGQTRPHHDLRPEEELYITAVILARIESLDVREK